MITAKVNKRWEWKVEEREGDWYINNEKAEWSREALPSGINHIIYNNRNYNIQLLDIDRPRKSIVLLINGQEYRVEIQEPLDKLLSAMGIQQAGQHKLNEIKAPMPGLVLKVLVEPGQQIKEGEPVLILEAMKMENVFKATTSAKVKEIRVKEKTAVEKGEVLVILE